MLDRQARSSVRLDRQAGATTFAFAFFFWA